MFTKQASANTQNNSNLFLYLFIALILSSRRKEGTLRNGAVRLFC